MKSRIFGLAPIGGPGSKILILGSMPGERSLELQQYYGHSMNQFWRILAEVFEAGEFRDYRGKKVLLQNRGIALWDVVKSCQRHGSSDLTIRKVKANDLCGFLRDHPGIRHILMNGRAAEKYFSRFFSRIVPVPYDYVPSTSPAHAGLSAIPTLIFFSGTVVGIAPISTSLKLIGIGTKTKVRLWKKAFVKTGILKNK